MTNKIMLLGSGELGKELVISLKRLGQTVIAVDNYENAPAMQVSDTYEVIDMLNADDLEKIVSKHMPDYIVPEVESIRTEKLYDCLLYTSPSPRDGCRSRMPSSA